MQAARVRWRIELGPREEVNTKPDRGGKMEPPFYLKNEK